MFFNTYLVLYCRKDQFWKIADFGLTSEGTSRRAKTTLYSRGTSSYRAPELIRDEKYTNKVDIWATGCIFYEVLFKEKAFSNDFAALEFARSVGSDKILRLPFERASLFYEISEIMKKPVTDLLHDMIHIDPQRRPSAKYVRKTILGIENIFQQASECHDGLIVISEADTATTYKPSTPGLFDLSSLERYPSLFAHKSDDVPYIDYFLNQVKYIFPYFEIFPRITNEIFQRATENQGLFHTVLSVSHFIADTRLKRSLMSAFHHEQQALGLIQKSISGTDISEAIAISIAMLVWQNLQQGNRRPLNHHLHGLHLIIQEIQRRGQNGTNGPTPLLMQIWRLSIRLDLLASTLYFPHRPLFSPVPMNQDHLHEPWIRLSMHPEQSTEWTLALLALEDLFHRTSHVARKVYKLRRFLNSAQQIQHWTSALLAELEHWRTRDIILKAQSYERKVNEGNTSLHSTCKCAFLQYPPLRVHNKFYANLLNTWRTIYILIDLMKVPEIGPGQRKQRFQYAVEICRTFASLGLDDMFQLGKVTTVFITGIALGGQQSPVETEWLYEMIKSLHVLFPLNRDATVCSFSCLDS